MKKILFSAATFFAANCAFSQITLEHSFADSEKIHAYTSGNEMFYVSQTTDNKLKIYNANYALQKTINIPIPSDYRTLLYTDDGSPYSISKHIFNIDDKYEFMINAYYFDSNTNKVFEKLILINEDGQLIKDFHPNAGTINSNKGFYDVFHDTTTNKNKLLVENSITNSNQSQFDVYSLPTSELTTKEIHNKNKLSAFPIPTNKILNVVNPENGINRIEVFDTSGKLVLIKNFANSDRKISLDVENLSKGIYVYKIGDLSSKFIKN